MGDFVTTKLDANFDAILNKLAQAAGESALRATGVAGAKVFQAEAIQRVHVQTGTIKRNIIIKHIDEQSEANKKQTYYVTVRTGKFGTEGDAYYWRWVEGGHNKSKPKDAKASWKAHREAMKLEFGDSRVAARPFMRPAYEAMKQTALTAMKTRLAEKVSEALKEMA